jgi:hypothetical protein
VGGEPCACRGNYTFASHYHHFDGCEQIQFIAICRKFCEFCSAQPNDNIVVLLFSSTNFVIFLQTSSVICVSQSYSINVIVSM